MTTPAVRARDTPSRTATPQVVVGVLIVDTEKRRARYECHRPGCPQRREGPVHGVAVPDFVRAIKSRHMAQYHGEQS